MDEDKLKQQSPEEEDQRSWELVSKLMSLEKIKKTMSEMQAARKLEREKNPPFLEAMRKSLRDGAGSSSSQELQRAREEARLEQADRQWVSFTKRVLVDGFHKSTSLYSPRILKA